jgi:hypothetical protein
MGGLSAMGANEDQYPEIENIQTPENFRIGWEIELLPQAFKNLVQDFDFESFQESHPYFKTKMKNDFFDDYIINNERAFEDLPILIKEKLTKDLDPKRLTVDKDGKSTGQKLEILDRSGKPISGNVAIIVPEMYRGNTEIKKSDDTPPTIIKKSDQLETIPRYDWEIINKRWQEIPLDEKLKVVKWENLNAIKKAVLAFKDPSGLKLKSDLGSEVQKIYKDLAWKKDPMGSIEFVYKDSVIVSDVHQFTNDILSFAKRAGVLTEIKDPINKKTDLSSLHIHYSVKGKDLTPILKPLNILLLSHRLKAGITGDLTEQSGFIFKENLDGRGLLRRISDSHFEVRTHHFSLFEELNLISSALNAPPSEGIKLIETQCAKNIDTKMLDLIAITNKDFLKRVSPYAHLDTILKFIEKRPEMIMRLDPNTLIRLQKDFHLLSEKAQSRITKTVARAIDKDPRLFLTMNEAAIILLNDNSKLFPKKIRDEIEQRLLGTSLAILSRQKPDEIVGYIENSKSFREMYFRALASNTHAIRKVLSVDDLQRLIATTPEFKQKFADAFKNGYYRKILLNKDFVKFVVDSNLGLTEADMLRKIDLRTLMNYFAEREKVRPLGKDDFNIILDNINIQKSAGHLDTNETKVVSNFLRKHLLNPQTTDENFNLIEKILAETGPPSFLSSDFKKAGSVPIKRIQRYLKKMDSDFDRFYTGLPDSANGSKLAKELEGLIESKYPGLSEKYFISSIRKFSSIMSPKSVQDFLIKVTEDLNSVKGNTSESNIIEKFESFLSLDKALSKMPEEALANLENFCNHHVELCSNREFEYKNISEISKYKLNQISDPRKYVDTWKSCLSSKNLCWYAHEFLNMSPPFDKLTENQISEMIESYKTAKAKGYTISSFDDVLLVASQKHIHRFKNELMPLFGNLNQLSFWPRANPSFKDRFVRRENAITTIAKELRNSPNPSKLNQTEKVLNQNTAMDKETLSMLSYIDNHFQDVENRQGPMRDVFMSSFEKVRDDIITERSELAGVLKQSENNKVKIHPKAALLTSPISSKTCVEIFSNLK